MASYFNASLMRKLLFLSLPVALVPLALVGYLSYSRARSSLIQSEFDKLEVMIFEKKEEVIRLLEQTNEDLIFLSETFRVRKALDELEEPEKAAGPAPTGTKETGSKVADAEKMFAEFLKMKGTDEGIEDFLLIRASDGQILFSQKKLEKLGSSVKAISGSGSGRAKVWETVTRTGKPAMSDFVIYRPTGAPAAFEAAPVRSFRTGKITGVLMMRIGPRPLTNIMQLNPGAGKTTKAYIVGKDFLLRTDLQFETESTALRTKARTIAAVGGLAGKRGQGIYRDYKGVPVLGVYDGLSLGRIKNLAAQFNWAIVCEMNESEAVAPALTLRSFVFLVASGMGILVAFLAVLLARSVTGPLSLLSRQLDKVRTGDLTVDVPGADRKDEIGSLCRSFAGMMDSLRRQIRLTSEGMNTLASSASEISATATQLATSTSKTSAALAQTATTVEEVKQAGQLASGKARRVADGAKQTVSVSESGREATEGTIEKMSLIKDQMETIGETVVRLSDQSRAIEDIISTVQDLADQSNLLAVNASIEAARAGEQGKGFAVVAHEIKSLADQSRGATNQVRAILEETRKWVSAVVMATEQGNKAVGAGVMQSKVASESIHALSDAVLTAAQDAGAIDTYVQQQFVGVDQVSDAMTNIEESMRQSVSGTNQLETAARRLEELGASLAELVQKYKV